MQCPPGWDAGTLLLRLSFLHDQSDKSDQSAIPLINYRKPRTNRGATLREQSFCCLLQNHVEAAWLRGGGRCLSLGYRLVSAALLPWIFLTLEGTAHESRELEISVMGSL